MKKIPLRFFLVYFLLTTAPWYWFYQIPGISFLTDYYQKIDGWIVNISNKYLLHVKDNLNTFGGGSGDTSFAWAQFYTYIILSVIGCFLWTVFDKREKTYSTLNFLLVNVVRYYVAMISFSYGIIKLFALQMPFPSLSQLATPLGDFLPMRLSWMFIGYSTTYQIFSGIMETMVGILLLNRKTATLGSLLGIGVFINVFMLNISYDIPVKLYSLQLIICCIFLAAQEWRRLLNFFLLNKSATSSTVYDIEYSKKWQKISRVVWKVGFIILFVILPLNDSWAWFKDQSNKAELKPIKSGIYDIKTFVKNGDTVVPVSANDPVIWKDFIFEKGGIGSINTIDTLFRQRYRRGYFTYQPDTLKNNIVFKKTAIDTSELFQMKYEILDENRIGLWGKVRNDSLFLELSLSNRHFQLTERQFHWISESNR